MSVADFSLEGKVAIVTGASRGIGRSIALGLAEHGAAVAIAARKPDPLAEAVSAVEAIGGVAIAVPTNVRRVDELQNLVEETESRLGRVDILVNNAGANPVYGPVQEIDDRAWDVIMNTNLKSVHFLSNAGSRSDDPQRRRRRHRERLLGRRLPRASDVIGGYSVSKAALIMLTQVQAKTWGVGRNSRQRHRAGPDQDGVRPRSLGGRTHAAWFATADAALHRIGEPEEMAGAVVYLASLGSLLRHRSDPGARRRSAALIRLPLPKHPRAERIDVAGGRIDGLE